MLRQPGIFAANKKLAKLLPSPIFMLLLVCLTAYSGFLLTSTSERAFQCSIKFSQKRLCSFSLSVCYPLAAAAVAAQVSQLRLRLRLNWFHNQRLCIFQLHLRQQNQSRRQRAPHTRAAGTRPIHNIHSCFGCIVSANQRFL